VVKTRLQSSETKNTIKYVSGRRRDFILLNLIHMKQSEGYRALFKGLGITLVGVIPARFVYFYSYNAVKSYLNNNGQTTIFLSVSIQKI